MLLKIQTSISKIMLNNKKWSLEMCDNLLYTTSLITWQFQKWDVTKKIYGKTYFPSDIKIMGCVNFC